MKRCVLALLGLLLLAMPAYADLPQPPEPPRPVDPAPSTLYVAQYAFPAVKDVVAERSGVPHERARLMVAGEGWGFSLIQRRWGWEMETAFCQTDSQYALVASTLDYLNGEPGALTIFFSVPGEYTRALEAVRR